MAEAEDEGLEGCGAFLEDGFQLEGPFGGGADFPFGAGSGEAAGGVEVGGVVGAEKEARAGRQLVGEAVEEGRGEEAVFPMAAFGPGVGEEGEDLVGGEFRRQVVEEGEGVGLEPMDVFQSGAGGFAGGAGEAVGEEVNAEAEAFGAGLGEGGEEVAVAAAEFEGDGRAGRSGGGGARQVAAEGEGALAREGVEGIQRHQAAEETGAAAASQTPARVPYCTEVTEAGGHGDFL